MPFCSLEDIVAAPVREGWAYWSAKCRDGMLPGRADIDPAEIPQLLAHVILADVSGAPPALSIQYRLVGTKVAELNGVDFTGYELNQGVEDPAWRSYWWQVYQQVVGTATPAFGRDVYAYRDRRHVAFEWCILPLAGDGAHVDMLLEIEAGLQAPPYGLGQARLLGEAD